MSFTPTNQHWHTQAASGPRATFSQRATASTIDAIITLLAALILATTLNTPFIPTTLLLQCAYYTLLEGGARGQTLGKAAMQIRVISTADGQPLGYTRALARDLARLLSGLAFYLGYLAMLHNPEKQTWHDKLTHTTVVPTTAYPPPTR
jgi:uncharacterized RDD family membrane protein YckC